MRLDRNINGDGRGKYALILLRKLAAFESPETFGQSEVEKAIETLDKAGLIDWGIVGSESEFFVTRLKDRNAAASLHGYAQEAEANGELEWAEEVRDMARRAQISPWKKRPD